jgi:hypothetical protein
VYPLPELWTQMALSSDMKTAFDKKSWSHCMCPPWNTASDKPGTIPKPNPLLTDRLL